MIVCGARQAEEKGACIAPVPPICNARNATLMFVLHRGLGLGLGFGWCPSRQKSGFMPVLIGGSGRVWLWFDCACRAG
jgi:hypothetical protein